eukprot:TRINITY_DN2349_c0_g1_i1.p1 TRINITY_DN2349_c0_g1~~TRINITY_DN2349_c0_g1_i1.p1  ORF type:complete len:496 (-),score=109.66 TRINITY_DN2349_c0_g1_i1:38-1525(-)
MATQAQRLNIDRIIKTKIVCTLGPASDTRPVLERLIEAGMDVVRLNFSHGEHEYHHKLFNLIRELGTQYDEQISIICDVQGPKIRTGLMKAPFHLAVGDTIRVTAEVVEGTKERITISYPHLTQDLGPNDIIYINDGIVKLVVKNKDGNDLVCVCEAPGQVSDHKGCNIPKGNLSIEIPTKKDKKDLEFIAKLNPEFVAASFIETASDVHAIRNCLKSFGNTDIKIISKIERPRALEHLDEIIEASDAVMVARGDLGVEIPPNDVPFVQKDMIQRCNRAGKVVIVATQMLESMVESSRPTRAEASDVYNAVLDGADCVMLSAETSVGKYVVEAVKYMDTIVATAEKYCQTRDPDYYDSTKNEAVQAIGNAAYHSVNHFLQSKFTGKVLCITKDGLNVEMVSKYRPQLPILAMTSDVRVARELNMTWGTRTILAADLQGSDIEDRAFAAVRKAVSKELLSKDDHVIVVSDSMKKGKKPAASGMWLGLFKVSEILDD